MPELVLFSAARKRTELQRLNELEAEGRFTQPGEGGLGFLDQEILPLVRALNEVPGVCTLQSCAGHEIENPGPEETRTHYDGQLWLWLHQGIANHIWADQGSVLRQVLGVGIGVGKLDFILSRIDKAPLLDLTFEHSEIDRLVVDLRAYFMKLSEKP